MFIVLHPLGMFAYVVSLLHNPYINECMLLSLRKTLLQGLNLSIDLIIHW
jgi:hypothetical protein